MGNSKKLHKSGSSKRKKKEKDLLRKEGQNPKQKKLNFVKSSKYSHWYNYGYHTVPNAFLYINFFYYLIHYYL